MTNTPEYIAAFDEIEKTGIEGAFCALLALVPAEYGEEAVITAGKIATEINELREYMNALENTLEAAQDAAQKTIAELQQTINTTSRLLERLETLERETGSATWTRYAALMEVRP